MINKHFFKSVLGFVAILAIGLVILFALNQFDASNNQDMETTAQPSAE